MLGSGAGKKFELPSGNSNHRTSDGFEIAFRGMNDDFQIGPAGLPPQALRLSSHTTDLLQPAAHGEVAISPGSAAKCPAVLSYPVEFVRLCFPSIDGGLHCSVAI
jgi:hypothetical protein